MQRLYEELERRGVDPWREDDFSELETVLKARGYDAGDVRRFME